MKKGKHEKQGRYARRLFGSRAAALVAALVLLAGGIVGGTVAWLYDSASVTNTFTPSNIDIELSESAVSFKMIPGCTISKDPKVTVKSGSEECWLFVKLEKSTNFDSFMSFTVASGWVQLTHDKDGSALTDTVYYRKVEAGEGKTVLDADQDFAVLSGNAVAVRDTVSKADMTALKADATKNPTLTITACASQLHKDGSDFTAAEAWGVLNPPPVTP